MSRSSFKIIILTVKKLLINKCQLWSSEDILMILSQFRIFYTKEILLCLIGFFEDEAF